MSVPLVQPDPQPIDGKYTLGRELGRGGSGTVYEAENLLLGKRIAIKLLHGTLTPGSEAAQRFLNEARSFARLSHPNLVDVQDLGISADGVAYLVMERLDGETLAKQLSERGRMQPVQACELLLQLLTGLAAAHRQGVVHGDLKPANVLVTYPVKDVPLLKILDFGAARWTSVARTEKGMTWGTPMYMAPEQVLGEQLDERADVYAASALLYVLLTGTEPYTGKTSRRVMEQVAAGEVRPLLEANPAMPKELIDIVERGMKRQRDARIGSVEELAELIGSRLDSLRQSARSGERALSQVAASPKLPRRAEGSRPPDSSVVRIEVSPRMVTDSLLMSPRLPKPPASPNLQAGRDFMPMHGDPERAKELEQRSQPTRLPRRAAGLVPALAAMLVGFGVGVVIAWAAGLI